ncbi:MAG: zinc ribbon domain-containing protein [Pseudomonadota bacterium]
MPIYEYACAACGHTFEEWQKMSDPPVRTCPKCKKKKVEKLISQTAFQLKGGGWYADLYSSSKKGGQGDGGGGGDKASGGDSAGSGKDGGSASASAKGDSKSDSKSDSKKDSKGDSKDAKKKDTPKKSESRAA